MASSWLILLGMCCCCIASGSNVEEAISDNDATSPAEQYFIDKLFNKYGDKGVISFEGFEHLLDSLGLGGKVFNSPHDLELHRINGSFQQFHDKLHRHKRSVNLTNKVDPLLSQKSCLSPKEILEVYGLEKEPTSISIKPKTFLDLCPALVYQLDQRSCYKMPAPQRKVDRKLAWIYATVSILIISATGLVGVAIVPLIKSNIFTYVLQFLVAIAVGTLCGDALMHLLPHAFQAQDHDHSKNADSDESSIVLKCGVTFLTIVIFYTLESVMQILHGGHQHDHFHPRGLDSATPPSKQVEQRPIELSSMMPDVPPPPLDRPMSSTALMVILGDGLHNLTDGLAIGAAFSNDPVTGFATSLAVFCHELPHELGDFAVLLRSGMSIKRALYYNLLSSFLSLMGMAGGLLLAEEHTGASQWIYAATAGTFLYIGLADLVPELNDNGGGKTINFVLAILGILAGGIIMLLIALHEDKMQNLFKSL